MNLRAIAALHAACLATPLFAQAAVPATPPAPPPPACTAPEFRQFDFWVGRWDVYPTGTDRLVAHSLIENLSAGCAIRKNQGPAPGPEAVVTDWHLSSGKERGGSDEDSS